MIVVVVKMGLSVSCYVSMRGSILECDFKRCLALHDRYLDTFAVF